MTKNTESQVGIKHIDIKHHFICELVANYGEIEIKWECNANMLAVNFTKALTIENFWCHQALLGILTKEKIYIKTYIENLQLTTPRACNQLYQKLAANYTEGL